MENSSVALKDLLEISSVALKDFPFFLYSLERPKHSYMNRNSPALKNGICSFDWEKLAIFASEINVDRFGQLATTVKNAK